MDSAVSDDEWDSKPMTLRQFHDYQSTYTTSRLLVILFIVSLPMILDAACIAHERAVCGFSGLTGFKNDYTESYCNPEVVRRNLQKIADAINSSFLPLQRALEQDLEHMKTTVARKQEGSTVFIPRPKTGTVATCSATLGKGTGVDPTVAE